MYINETPNILIPAVFKRSSAEDPLPLFEAEYRLAMPNKDKLQNAKYDHKIHLCLYNTKNEEEPELKDNDVQLSKDEIEAAFVAKKIKQLLSSSDEQGNPKTPVNPKQIAMLFRTLTKQHIYERYLRMYGIPYTCEATGGFFADGPVNDLLSFLRLWN